MDDYRERYERGCEEISVEEVAHRLGRNSDTIKAWIRGKHVPWGQYIKLDQDKYGAWVIRRKAFEAWLAGGPEVVHQTIVIDAPEAYEILRRAVINTA